MTTPRSSGVGPYVAYVGGLIAQAVPDCDHPIRFLVAEGAFGAVHGDDEQFQQVLDLERVMRDDEYGKRVATDFGRAVRDYVLSCHNSSEFNGG